MCCAVPAPTEQPAPTSPNGTPKATPRREVSGRPSVSRIRGQMLPPPAVRVQPLPVPSCPPPLHHRRMADSLCEGTPPTPVPPPHTNGWPPHPPREGRGRLQGGLPARSSRPPSQEPRRLLPELRRCAFTPLFPVTLFGIWNHRWAIVF